jgi:hypothetical protein
MDAISDQFMNKSGLVTGTPDPLNNNRAANKNVGV